jgi:hypothetical protein
MKEETKSQLDSLMKTFDENSEAAEGRADEIKTKKETFLRAFEALKKETIRPVMDEISTYLSVASQKYVYMNFAFFGRLNLLKTVT